MKNKVENLKGKKHFKSNRNAALILAGITWLGAVASGTVGAVYATKADRLEEDIKSGEYSVEEVANMEDYQNDLYQNALVGMTAAATLVAAGWVSGMLGDINSGLYNNEAEFENNNDFEM